MPKAGEITYLQFLGESGVRHAVNKPFSDVNSGEYLIALGAIRLLLPPPPARILELGCGTGWVGCLLAKMGYEVVGQDISPDMIYHANVNKQRYEVPDATFIVSDYELMSFDGRFDGAVFFDSLHHAEDERAALAAVYQALRNGGVCVTHEPGQGHATAETSLQAVRKFNVTEKDMPAHRIVHIAREVGFAHARVYPFPERMLATFFGLEPTRQAWDAKSAWKRVLHRIRIPGRRGRRLRRMYSKLETSEGLVVLEK